MTNTAYIQDLEKKRIIDPDCKVCKEFVYPMLLAGMKMYEIFVPRHKVNDRCESGKRPHCTCDRCF